MRVAPVTREWAEALAEGDEVFSARFGVEVEPGWADSPEVIALMLRSTRAGEPPEWGPHLYFDDDGTLVGNGGWRGAPTDGIAELGYAVAPGRQGRGIATRARAS